MLQVGWVTFAQCRRYDSHEQWAADARLHCVGDGTPYSWQQGARLHHLSVTQHIYIVQYKCQPCNHLEHTMMCLCHAGRTQELFGWVVGSWATLRQPRAMPSATRMLRSLYELEADDAQLLCEEAV